MLRTARQDERGAPPFGPRRRSVPGGHQPRPWRHTMNAAVLATPKMTASSTTSRMSPTGSGFCSLLSGVAGRATSLAAAVVVVVGGGANVVTTSLPRELV